MKKQIVVILAAATCSLFPLADSAFAQGTFTPGSGTTANCNTGGLTVDTKQCSQGSVVVDMTAYGFTNTLGYTFFGDSIYPLEFTFTHAGREMTLNFSSSLFCTSQRT